MFQLHISSNVPAIRAGSGLSWRLLALHWMQDRWLTDMTDIRPF